VNCLEVQIEGRDHPPQWKQMWKSLIFLKCVYCRYRSVVD